MEVVQHINVPYKPDTKHPNHRLDIFIPRENTRRCPTFIYLHGGGWQNRDRSDYHYLGRHLASHGIPTVLAGYRLSTMEAPLMHPEPHLDAAAALAWVIESGSVNQTRVVGQHGVVVAGHSAGGFMSCALGIHALHGVTEAQLAQVKAVIPIQGMYDLVSIVQERPEYKSWIESLFGADQAKWNQASPQQLPIPAYRLDIPVFVIHCRDDELVSVTQATNYVEKLQKANMKRVSVAMDRPLAGTHFQVLETKEFLQLLVDFMQKTFPVNQE